MHIAINARFWIFHNNAFSKITLRPGQVVHFGQARTTDEGWHYDGERIAHDGTIIHRTTVSDGVDCDGRLSHCWETRCHVTRLASRDTDEGYKLPGWVHVTASQHDANAEAAGY